MSTSDPDRPADDTTAPVDGSTPPAQTVRATSDEPATAHQPAVESSVAKPVAAPTEPATVEPAPVEPARSGEPVVAAPVAAAPDAAASEPAGLDTGRHAVVRPAPVPPDDPTPDPVVATTPTAPIAPAGTPYPATTTLDPAVAAVAAGPAASTPVTSEPVASYGAITPEPADDGRLFPDPNAPSSPSLGSRVLGVLVGLILAPVAVGVLLLGESQILEAQVDGWDATTSVFGIVLVTLGLLLLGCVLLLGVWTAAVPITGGALLTAVGAVYLYAPSIARDQTLHILTSSGWRLTITQVTVAATSGMALAVGFLLLLAGIVIASARRRGVHLGEFRERHKV